MAAMSASNISGDMTSTTTPFLLAATEMPPSPSASAPVHKRCKKHYCPLSLPLCRGSLGTLGDLCAAHKGYNTGSPPHGNILCEGNTASTATAVVVATSLLQTSSELLRESRKECAASILPLEQKRYSGAYNVNEDNLSPTRLAAALVANHPGCLHSARRDIDHTGRDNDDDDNNNNNAQCMKNQKSSPVRGTFNAEIDTDTRWMADRAAAAAELAHSSVKQAFILDWLLHVPTESVELDPLSPSTDVLSRCAASLSPSSTLASCVASPDALSVESAMFFHELRKKQQLVERRRRLEREVMTRWRSLLSNSGNVSPYQTPFFFSYVRGSVMNDRQF